MKKLLVLVLVLALASVASATVSFQLDSLVGSVATVKVVSTANETSLFLGAISATGGTVSSVGTLSSQLNAGAVSQGTWKDGSVNGIRIFQISGAVDTTQSLPPVSAGNALYTFTIDLGALTTVTIDDWTGMNPFGMPPFPVETKVSGVLTDIEALVIPEPMTIALLGLGGLFLRRRK